MDSQPEAGILIELSRACFRIVGDFCRQQLAVTLAFGWRGVCIDGRLYDASCA
jgi:hypothetical protein